MSSRSDLHFYQVLSKYSKWYSSYRADKKFYADTDTNANVIRPKREDIISQKESKYLPKTLGHISYLPYLS